MKVLLSAEADLSLTVDTDDDHRSLVQTATEIAFYSEHRNLLKYLNKINVIAADSEILADAE